MKLLPHWVSRSALAALVVALAIGAVLPSLFGWSVYTRNQVTETMLFEEPYVIVMRPKHPLSAFADIGRGQLADYDWIVPGPSTPRYLAFERLFASAKKRPTARVSTASRGLIRSLIATSRDVVHGLIVPGANVNTMLLPGQVARVTARFDRPGEYPMICHEYCGIAHHTMSGKIIVEPRS